MAGLDYKRVKSTWNRARLLFVAHRGEILQQSLTTFRAILKDGEFGDLWTGQHQPTQSDHLFASVQKLSHEDLESFQPDHFDVLIIDEFHHAAANTYDRLLRHFRPKLLLGLTATPERADGRSVLSWFNGHIAAELRLWSALERGLLCPFQYFGISDNTDLRGVDWRGKKYVVSQLESVYTGDQMRVKLIIQQLKRLVAWPEHMRALGFCVSVGHARFMTRQFRQAGFEAACVTGESSSQERREAIAALRKGKLGIIFTVDVFNEGVDLPEVDTLAPAQTHRECDRLSSADGSGTATFRRQRVPHRAGFHRTGAQRVSLRQDISGVWWEAAGKSCRLRLSRASPISPPAALCN